MEQASEHARELDKKEAEKEIILDDHEALSDQYQHLNMSFESQAVKLAEAEVRVIGGCGDGVIKCSNMSSSDAQADLVRVREELDRSEVELNRLLQDKMTRRTSIVKVRES